MRYDPPVRETTRVSLESLPAAAPARAPVDARAKAALLTSIATELWDAEQVTTVITAQRRIRPDLDVPYLAPTTACEKQVAEMFGKVLGVEHVGINDDFFSLGGHSLLATMLIQGSNHRLPTKPTCNSERNPVIAGPLHMGPPPH